MSVLSSGPGSPSDQPTQTVSKRPELPSEHFPQGWLPQSLRVRDLTVLSLFAVLLISNIQTIGSGGAVGVLYWLLGFVLFLFPSALICAQLYRLFPGEGAVYLWANKAFGNFWDTFIGFFCNWWPGAIGLTVEAGAVVASIQALNPNWLASAWQQGAVEIGVLVIGQALCFFSHRSLQRLLNASFYAYLCLFVLVGCAGLVWLASGHAIQTDFSMPAWQLNASNYPLFATVTVALLGVAIPMNMAGEIAEDEKRRGHRYVYWGCAAIVGGYLFATFGVFCVLSPTDLKNPLFLGLVFQHAFGPIIGTFLSIVAYLVLIVYFVCATAAYNALFARLLLVASVDRRLPAVLRRLNTHRVPFNAMLVQTAMNVVFVVVLFFVIPSSSPMLSTTFFLVIMNGASTVWYIAMIGLFLCGLLLCIRYRTELTGRWIVPPVIVYLAAIVGILVCCVAIFTTFFVGSPLPDVLNNQDWVFWVLLVVLASLTIGAIYSFLVPEAEDLITLLHTWKDRSAAKQPMPHTHEQSSQMPMGQLPFSHPLSQSPWQPEESIPTRRR